MPDVFKHTKANKRMSSFKTYVCTLLVIILFFIDLGQMGLQRYQSIINLSDFNLLQDQTIILVRRNYME